MPLHSGDPARNRANIAGGSVQRLFSIQVMRGLAAFSVVVFHAAHYQRAIHGDASFLVWFKWGGGLGVTAFFVISGFLMASLARSSSASTFALHRLTRIYPVYWIAVLLAASACFLAWYPLRHDADYLPDLFGMLTRDGTTGFFTRSILVPARFSDTPLGVEWTLSYELAFYAALTLIVAVGLSSRLLYVAVVWLIAIIAASVIAPGIHNNYVFPSPATIFFTSSNYGFIFGIFVYAAYARFPGRFALPALFLGTALVYQVLTAGYSYGMIQFSLGIALFIFAAVQAEAGPMQMFRGSWFALVRKLGDWSYALYLCHVTTMVLALKFLGHAFSSPVTFIAIVLAAVLVSAPLGELDIWLYRRLKRAITYKKSALREPRLDTIAAAHALTQGAITQAAMPASSSDLRQIKG
ncbi:MAG: acyltransferase [Rhodomicrobium sp.]